MVVAHVDSHAHCNKQHIHDHCEEDRTCLVEELSDVENHNDSDSDDSDIEEGNNSTGTAGQKSGAGQGATFVNGRLIGRNERKARKMIAKLGLRPVPNIQRVTLKRGRNAIFAINHPEVYQNPISGAYVIFGEAKYEDISASSAAAAAAAAGHRGMPGAAGQPWNNERMMRQAREMAEKLAASGNLPANFAEIAAAAGLGDLLSGIAGMNPTNNGNNASAQFEDSEEKNDNIDAADESSVSTSSLSNESTTTSTAGSVDEDGMDPRDIATVMSQAMVSRPEAVRALRENGNDIVNAIMALSL